MPPHNAVIAIRPRTLANVLSDLKEARRDVEQARMDVLNGDDAEDRVTEAETRQDDLRDELAARFHEVTGLTVEDFRGAYADALI